jgi:hypothetical protein
MIRLNLNLRTVLFILAGFIAFAQLYSQNTPDTLKGKNIYNPDLLRPKDTTFTEDSLDVMIQQIRDSIQARLKFIQDSIEARLKFIQDSIEAREKFIRDSIQRRQRILDSLNFLKAELPKLIDASLKTFIEDIIIDNDKLKIIGDSILSDYTCRILPFKLNQPFKPWKLTLNLSDNPVKINVDTIRHKIISIKSPIFNCSFNYRKQNNIVIIKEQSTVLNNRSGKFYSEPFDSVLFDRRGRVVKIKRYIQFYQVTGNYQRGAPLFVHLSRVKQFEYNTDNLVSGYQVVNFCDRWSKEDENKVCNIITYNLTMQGKEYILTCHNDPVNEFASGTFRFEFDNMCNLKSVSFKNIKNTEDWKCYIDLNNDGNVIRYAYENKGIVSNAFIINYYLDVPGARHKVETISCTYEDDGVSYYQRNNTTGKSRIRNRLTGEWGPWQ